MRLIFNKAFLLLILLTIAVTSNADPLFSGKFNLIDHNNVEVTEESYQGKLRLVFFGYTSCPDVCPTTIMYISAALRQLGDKAEQVQPLFISIDPSVDTPERMKLLMDAFSGNFVGLTGSQEQVDAALEAFNATAGKTPSKSIEGAFDVYHSAYLYLMDRDGQFIDLLGYGVNADDIAEKVTPYLY